MKQKYTGYRYSYFITPSDTEWYHIANIDVYLYKDDVCSLNDKYTLVHKFKDYMPSASDIEDLKSIVKKYIHGLLIQKYKNITLLPPKEHKYVWDIKIIKE